MKCDWKLLAIFDLFSFDNPIGEMMPGTEMVRPLNCLNAFELTTQITAHADPNFSLLDRRNALGWRLVPNCPLRKYTACIIYWLPSKRSSRLACFRDLMIRNTVSPFRIHLALDIPVTRGKIKKSQE